MYNMMAKISPSVVNAVKRMQEPRGSTVREINDYLSREYDVPQLKKHVQLALKRAVSYGILKNNRGHYVYNMDMMRDYSRDEMDAKDKVLERKARRSRRRSRSAGRRKVKRRTSKRRRAATSASRNSVPKKKYRRVNKLRNMKVHKVRLSGKNIKNKSHGSQASDDNEEQLNNVQD